MNIITENLQEAILLLVSAVVKLSPIIASALIAVFMRNIFEWVKDRKKAQRTKKILLLELEDNIEHLKSALITLSEIHKTIIIKDLTEETFNDFRKSEPASYKDLRTMLSEADRHLNLISVLVYKEIYLKLNRNFNSKQDELLHLIYFNLLKVESYKSFISEIEDEQEKDQLEIYFKLHDISNDILKFYEMKELDKMKNSNTNLATLRISKSDDSEKLS